MVVLRISTKVILARGNKFYSMNLNKSQKLKLANYCELFLLNCIINNKINYTFTRRKTLIFFKDMLLKELFKSKGIKQKWLASKLGVSEVTVSNWVKEKSNPSQKNLEKISEILNISMKELVN